VDSSIKCSKEQDKSPKSFVLSLLAYTLVFKCFIKRDKVPRLCPSKGNKKGTSSITRSGKNRKEGSRE